MEQLKINYKEKTAKIEYSAKEMVVLRATEKLIVKGLEELARTSRDQLENEKRQLQEQLNYAKEDSKNKRMELEEDLRSYKNKYDN